MQPSPNYHFCLQIRKKNSKSPNGSIRKVKWLESKSEHFLQNLPTTGGQRPSLRNFSANNKNKVLDHFIDLGWFDLSDMAYSDR